MDNSPNDFQQIADAVRRVAPMAKLVQRESTDITRAVIQKLIDITPSPQTVDELTRILKTETETLAYSADHLSRGEL